MGYTHYWRKPESLAKNQFGRFVEDVEKIILASSGIQLRNNMGEPGTVPEVTQELVSFNGAGTDAHEAFYVSREEPHGHRLADGRVFNFCKTAEKPYDAVVVACLYALIEHCPSVSASSDGGFLEREAGRELYCAATGRQVTRHFEDDKWLEIAPVRPATFLHQR